MEKEMEKLVSVDTMSPALETELKPPAKTQLSSGALRVVGLEGPPDTCTGGITNELTGAEARQAPQWGNGPS